MAASMDTSSFQLPISVVGRVDVGRMSRELDSIDEFLRQSSIREPGTTMKLPKTSRLLDEMIAVNSINLLRDTERFALQAYVQMVVLNAPVMHISFSADPSPQFMRRLVAWVRAELHPLVLLDIGLQPNIGAGCVIRTPNKYFDFSLRTHLTNHTDDLLGLMRQDVHEGAHV